MVREGKSMKKNIKINKLLIILIMILTLNVVFTTSVNATLYQDYTPGGNVGSAKLQTMAGKILGLIRNVGIAISIIALSIIGVKYMVGSVEEKAGYKKSMVPFVIGVILLAASTTLVKIIYDAVASAGL